jgi:hypothetical protein
VGHLCDSADGCTPDLICKNSVCIDPPESQPGNVGAVCNSKQVCQEHLPCIKGECQKCISRPSITPRERGEKLRSYSEKPAIAGSLHESCHTDVSTRFSPDPLLRTLPFCKKPLPHTSVEKNGNPCTNAAHCDANEFCDWGLCKLCTEGCLGMVCKSNNKCKTGFCNAFGRCDYPSKPKIVSGPGARAVGR